jgi:hypothetical protein
VYWFLKRRYIIIEVWIWCKYCVYMYLDGKMRPVETIPGIREEGGKEEW